jgi:hypothetical protein
MNPILLAVLAEKNGADIEAIVAKIGIGTLLSLAPHLVAILETIQAQPHPK